jgi:predicted Fe-Mo cluster-binding NifX family protein
MKIAVPEHKGRVAPVFDTCLRVLIFTQDADGEKILSLEDWSATGRHRRPDRLSELGVEILLCGGISGWMQDQLNDQGIQTRPWLAGEVSEILVAFRQGRIMAPQYAMPGCAKLRMRDGRGNEACGGRQRSRRQGKGKLHRIDNVKKAPTISNRR